MGLFKRFIKYRFSDFLWALGTFIGTWKIGENYYNQELKFIEGMILMLVLLMFFNKDKIK